MFSLLLAIACAETLPDVSSPVDSGSPSLVGTPIREVTYEATWGLDGLRALETGWTQTTDLGYEVTVETGWIVSYSASLTPCSGVAARVRTPSPLAWLIPTAHAGHGDDADPSTLPAPQAESLHAPTPHQLAALSFDEATYCHIHYLVARSSDTTIGLPDLPDLEGSSLYLAGSWTTVDGESTPFVVDTDLNYGRLYVLEDAWAGGSGSRATVTIHRDLSGWFDGLDLIHLDQEELARELIASLLEHTEVSVTLR